MRRMDGATATAAVREAGGPVLVLGTFDDDEILTAARRARTAGFVVKYAPSDDILRAIATVAGGDAWMDPSVAGQVLAAYTYRDHAPRT